jgi:hypothetical protein
MKRTRYLIIVFNILLFTAIGLAYYLQLSADNYSYQSLDFSYSFNLLFTFIFTNIILILHRKIGQHLGFVFLAQLTLKIILFLILKKFYVVDAFELPWQTFFVPYIICLIVEVSAILYLLKQKDKKQDFSSKKS